MTERTVKSVDGHRATSPTPISRWSGAAGFSGRSCSSSRRTSPGSLPTEREFRLADRRALVHCRLRSSRDLSVTLGLTVVAMVLGIAIGLVLAIARMSQDMLLSRWPALFIWFFRGTPLLVQLIFWYNLSTLFPDISISIPFGPTLASWNTNDLITPMTAAIAGLSLNEAAYMAEIIRGGLLSVDKGQVEATDAFGMSRGARLAAHHHSAGDALHHPADRQPAHQHDQGDIARQRHRHGGSAVFGAGDLQPDFRSHPDAAGGGDLVPDHDIHPQCRAGLHRTLLCPRRARHVRRRAPQAIRVEEPA